jgi:hypothetical protein
VFTCLLPSNERRSIVGCGLVGTCFPIRLLAAVQSVTKFYCLRFETSLLVASYYSQGYGGGIRPRFHTGFDWVATIIFKITPWHGPRRSTQFQRALLLLCIYSFLRERVYRAVAYKRLWYIRLSRGRLIATALHATE